eukprot:TRINITY_DN4814_c0_g1_i3.p1 TRINITY_DN4814_c0_g1~~TRINITY_DN4814_c0_g1_i3.p1  ORF type:complete len:114 (-),score=28.35 TRINITY_DN4814_c0_g1_i3:76-417(-)
MDARDFIKHIASEQSNKKIKAVTHVFMNLPMTAHEFLDAFVGAFSKDNTTLPMIHCYCFSNAVAKHKELAIKKIEKVLGSTIHPTLSVKVRQTASNTKEYCISFVLPAEIAYK